MNRRSSSKFVLLSSAVAMCPILASGQTPPASQPDEIAEIVVTAQKKQQSIDTVGMSINAATGLELRELGVNSVGDLTKIEPSFAVSLNENGEPFYQIRGIGFNTDSLGAPPAVSVYVDEAPLPYSILTKGATLDLERVEVLKGPQGTLFGQNATGGAVNYIAAKPTDTFEAGVDATYARFDAVTVDGFLSGPLVEDKLKARLAFSVDEGGAWQRSVTTGAHLGAKDNQVGRLLLDWTPTESLKVSLNLNAWADNSDRQAPADYALTLLSPRNGKFVPLVVNEPIAPHDPTAADWAPQVRPRNNENFYQGSLRIDYDFSDALAVVYLGSYNYFHAHDANTYSGTLTPLWGFDEANIHSMSHELRASGKILSDKLEWIIGGNYSKDTDKESLFKEVIGVSTAYTLIGLPGVTSPFSLYDTAMTQDITTKAVFGNLEYHIFDNLSVHGGTRYTESDNNHTGCMRAEDPVIAQSFTAYESVLRHGIGVVPIPIGGCITINPATQLPTLTVNSLDEHNVSWRFGIDWSPINKTLLYATASRGYKAGSYPNIGAVTTKALTPARQEQLTAYEIGVNSRLDGGRLKINGAVFLYEYKNKQEELRVPDPVFGLLLSLLNVPKSEEKGAELSITYRPVASLTLNGSTTYLDSYVSGNFYNYSQFATSAANAINFKGEQLPDTPRWVFDVGARYDWLVGDYSAYVAGDVKYSSRTQSYFGAYAATAAGYPSMDNASYAILNLRLGLESGDNHWRFELFGNNITNTYYTVQSVRNDNISRWTGMPATYGAQIGYRY